MNAFQRFVSWLLSFDLIRKIFLRKETEYEKERNLREEIEYEKERKRERKRPSKPIFCSICKKELVWITEFKCSYCGKCHCKEHQLPENHDCLGKLRSPPAEYRIIYSKGKTEYRTK